MVLGCEVEGHGWTGQFITGLTTEHPIESPSLKLYRAELRQVMSRPQASRIDPAQGLATLLPGVCRSQVSHCSALLSSANGVLTQLSLYILARW